MENFHLSLICMDEEVTELGSISLETTAKNVLDTEGKARESYLERRMFIEGELRKKGEPRKDKMEMEGGATVNVLSSFVEIPESIEVEEKGKKKIVELKKEDDEYNIAIYVPGLFQADKPNYGNHPLEVKLAGSLLRSNTDAIMMLKAEGLNDKSYEDEEGNGKVQTTVSKAALEVLKKTLKERGLVDEEGKLSRKMRFSVVGYSEGSTQGASIAARIAESGFGEVKEFVSIGGAGLVGFENQSEVNLVKFFKNAQEARKNPYLPAPDSFKDNQGNIHSLPFTKEGAETSDTVFVEGKLLGDKKQGGLETSLGQAKVNTFADIRNIGKWSTRLLASEMGLIEQVPRARLNAAATLNHDYDLLAEKGVPIIVFSPTQEIFFPNTNVRERVGELRTQFPNDKILLVSSNVGHDFPHSNPSGTAYAIELIKERAGVN